MQSATLTLTLADYESLKAQRTKAEDDLAVVTKQLAEARLEDPSGKLAPLNQFARDCLTIVRFAVANLPPETIRGWPYEELKRICQTLHVLPDFSTNDRDMALDVLGFAREAEDLELRRKSTATKPTKFTDEELAERKARLENDPIASALIKRMQGQPDV
ncbi:MAG: hypothetical protein ACREJC_12975 [Tepidisphaeraceae bacterium]